MFERLTNFFRVVFNRDDQKSTGDRTFRTKTIDTIASKTNSSSNPDYRQPEINNRKYKNITLDIDPENKRPSAIDSRLDDRADRILSPKIPLENILSLKSHENCRGGYGMVKKSKLYMTYIKRNPLFSSKTKVEKFYVAAKKMNLSQRERVYYFINEIAIHKACDHSNIVKFVGVVYVNPEKFYLVSEMADAGDLRDWIIGEYKQDVWSSSNISQILHYALGIAKAIRYLHQNDILHRDIKSRNILMFTNRDERPKNNGFYPEYIPKIADFGGASSRTHGYKSQTNTNRTGTIIGTFEYLAPEIQRMQRNFFEYTEKVDVYSYGVVLAELICGQHPFNQLSHRDVEYHLSTNNLFFKRLEVRIDCPQEIVGLCWNCTSYNSAFRYNFIDICEILETSLNEFIKTKDYKSPAHIMKTSVLVYLRPEMSNKA
ncbi:unnamed protein product [Brachionus calyciflorus]|uniref:Protein kinase domain-containing protein n=1 Tax=Brachionus calyciflorus TaxID=104777 RepID=A0A813M129_9BILA|nr:unnamed protein product [Brachionus calyciflorus]